MRIDCPYCGSRDSREFTVIGDAGVRRPPLDGDAKADALHAYVYERDNPAGLHAEHWFHGQGCHAWLVVTRDTRNHRVVKVEAARSITGDARP